MTKLRVIYNAILILTSPVLALYYLWLVFGSRKCRGAWKEQIGRLPDSVRRVSSRPRVWIHAVSAGEAVAGAPVFRELRSILPDVELVASTTTAAGQEMVRKNIPEADLVIRYPLDFLPFVRRALNTVKPDVFVSIESEIWPNFLAEARSMGVRCLIINGVVSDKAFRRALRIKPIYRWALSNIERFLMQTQLDADRIMALGAPPSKIEVVGNCKFDQENGSTTVKPAEIREKYGIKDGIPIFIAGSTNPGEDEPVLEAFRIAREQHPTLRLILAPRQIERAEEICALIRRFGFTYGVRSKPETIMGSEDVIVLDTFGELSTTYAIGSVAFVGGSLIAKGGHNILQPLAYGLPVIFGPYMFKARDLAAQAKAAGVGFEVENAAALGRLVAELISDTERLERIRADALRMMNANRGASRRCAEAIAEAVSVK